MEGLPGTGDLVAGKYQVERVLGVGGMGIVVAAMHLHLQERVAIKILLPAMTSADTVARFAREARAAAKIKSEYVARVTDVGTLETGAPYMVMEYLDGDDLSAVIRDRGALPFREAVEHVLQACEAVAEAHSLGIVHRDLKPANLFLARRSGAAPRVKVLDFGISKVMERAASMPDDHSMTKTTTWLGSPLYMSPEQMKSARDVDGRADIWALGLILFELLTGRTAYSSTTFPELCAEILHTEPPPLEDLRPDAPLGLGSVIRRCVNKDPSLRYANVGELAMALVEFAPQRARSVAERAVSVSEAAGLMVSGGPRTALDATMNEPLASAVPPSSRRSRTTGVPVVTTAGVAAAFTAADAEPALFTDGKAATAPAAVALAEAPASISTHPPRPSPHASALPSDSDAQRPASSFRGALVVLAVVGALLGVAGGVYQWRAGRAHPAPPAPTQEPAAGAPSPTAEAAMNSAQPADIAVPTATATTPAADAGSDASNQEPLDAGPVDASLSPAATSSGGARDAAGVGRPPPRPAPGKLAPPATADTPAEPLPSDQKTPPPPVNTDLSTTRCVHILPDGSKTQVPCPQ